MNCLRCKCVETMGGEMKRSLLIRVLLGLALFVISCVGAAPSYAQGTGTLRGTIFDDMSDNGVFDPDEMGIPNSSLAFQN